jgi:hypothetical protein
MRKRRCIWTLQLVGLLLIGSSCASYTTFKTADALPQGRSKLVVAAQLQGAGTTDGVVAPMPELVIGWRRGVAPQLEAGVTATLLPLGEYLTAASVELAAKRHLWSSVTGRWSLALGVGAGYRYTGSSGAIFEAVHAAMPLIIGLHVGAHQLVLSPTVGLERWYSTGAQPINLPFAGASLGLLWQVSPRIALLPETTWADSSARNFMTENSRLFHVGIAVVVTGR